MRRLLVIAGATVIATLITGVVLHRYGRSLWHPLWLHITGGASVAQRMRDIEERMPELAGLAVGSVTLIGFKDPGRLDMLIDGRFWRSFPWTATSGGPGPKVRQGDGQIPEGFYRIDAVNPDSAFHLSLRISYPNQDDLRRSAAAGVSDPGGDIYIHGKEASIGCIAVGDDAIEKVFYVVNRIDPAAVEVVILPWDLRRRPPPPGEVELYARLRTVVTGLPLP